MNKLLIAAVLIALAGSVLAQGGHEDGHARSAGMERPPGVLKAPKLSSSSATQRKPATCMSSASSCRPTIVNSAAHASRVTRRPPRRPGA